MPNTADRLNLFTESVIREMTRVAKQYGAINLSQGFPDVDPPAEVLGRRSTRHGRQAPTSTPSPGAPRVSARPWPAKQRRWMGLDIDPDAHIVVTCGSTEAMMVRHDDGLQPRRQGDRLFALLRKLRGRHHPHRRRADLRAPAPAGFRLRSRRTAGAPSSRGPRPWSCATRPTRPARSSRCAELAAIAALAEEFDAFVITDEVYEHIVYAPHRHIYMAALPGMFERTISCSSLSKTYTMTGWRLGYVIGPPEVIAGARKVHDFLTVGAAAPLQEAAVTALELPADLLRGAGGRLHPQARSLPGRPGRGRADLHRAPGRLLRDGGLLRIRRDRRQGLLPMDGARGRRGGRARLQLLPRTGPPPDPAAFFKIRSDPGRNRQAAQRTEGAALDGRWRKVGRDDR